MYHDVQQAIEHNQITIQELVKGILCVMAAGSIQILVENTRVSTKACATLMQLLKNRFADEEIEVLC